MYYYKFPYIIYRNYQDYGYLTDNRNFGYDTASKSCLKLGDRILSKSGSVFYSVLSEHPRSLTEIVDELCSIFSDAVRTDIENDAYDFFLDLSRDGFIGQVSSLQDVSLNSSFSYDSREPLSFSDRENSDESSSLDGIWNDEYRLVRVHLNISGPCNEHCVHCYFPDEYRTKIMSKAQFCTILDQCIECNVMNITLSGGEPMLNSNLIYFTDKCKENNFSVNILSNLTLLTDDMVSVFSKTPLLSVQTSLYSMDAAIHDSITKVKGSFIKTKHAIEVLREHNVPMQINCPIMKQNKDTYQTVLDWATSLNIEANSDYMIFGCFDGLGGNLSCRLDPSQVEILLKKNNVATNIVRKSTDDTNGLSESRYSVCPVCLNSLCISYDGSVYPCEGWQSMILGNVNDTPLSCLWAKSEGINKLRGLTIEEDFPQCAACENKDYCSICLIRNANESSQGDYKNINPYFCEIARIKKNLAKN